MAVSADPAWSYSLGVLLPYDGLGGPPAEKRNISRSFGEKPKA